MTNSVRAKDEERVIELPCKVGDWFYPLYYRDGEWRIWTEKIEVIRATVSSCGIAVKLYGMEVAVEDRELNHTVFLNYNDALKACKERNDKNDPSSQNTKEILC